MMRRGGPGDVVSPWYCESAVSWTRELPAPHSGASSPPSRVVERQAPPGLPQPRGGQDMDQLIARCAGLDVHKQTIAVCLRLPGPARCREPARRRAPVAPPEPIRELRDLTRYRKSLIEERTREANRLHKVLEDAGVKLASVATKVLGELAKGRLRAKLPALRQALAGRFRGHHAFLVSQLLAHLDYMEEAIDALSARLGEV